MESVSNPAISPDGLTTVFTRPAADSHMSAEQPWIVEADGSRTRATSGTWRDSQLVWSPDGKRIAFLSTAIGTNQLHVLWVDTREAAQLYSSRTSAAGINWSPDGKFTAFTAF
jgi:Tol biopolymer transport system component